MEFRRGLAPAQGAGVAQPPQSQGLHDLPYFRHWVAADGFPELTCELHRGLITQGVHLASRCQGWSDDLVRQQRWAPEVA
jgi:hypothetical protein